MVAQFLTQPAASPAEWEARAKQRFGAEAMAGLRNLALGYALLLNAHFQPAAALLKQMYDSGAPAADEGLPYLLAWAYLETGRGQEAAPLIHFNAPLPAAGPSPFLTFYLPRLFYIRRMVAASQGKREEARPQLQLFLRLSGKEPLVWGEEKKAEAALK